MSRRTRSHSPPPGASALLRCTQKQKERGISVKQHMTGLTHEQRRERGGKENLGSGGVAAAGIFVTVGGGGWRSGGAPREGGGRAASSGNGAVAAKGSRM